MDKQVPLMNQLSSTQSPLTATAIVSPTIPVNPSWSIFFGLVVVIVLIGFFLIYLITKYMKQEKTIETLKRKVESIPSSDNIIELIKNDFEYPMMRNVHSLIETRLFDYDRFVQQAYVRRESVNQTQTNQSLDENQTDDDLPPLIDETQEEKSNVAQASDPNVPAFTESTQPSIRMPHSLMSRRVHDGPREAFGSHQHSASDTLSSQSAPSTSNSNTRSGGRSMLIEALPSLISMFTGSGSDPTASSASGVTLPVIISDIMTLMNNQQVRQRRREQMAPSSEAPPPSESPSAVQSPSASNNRIRRDNQREE